MKRIIGLILCAVLFCSALVSCGNTNASDLEKVQSAGKIVVGMECAYAPYNWTVSTASETTHPIANSPGSYADGYDVAIAKLIAAGLGVSLEIKAIEWEGLIPALEAGEIDMIIAGMSPTAEREEEVDFTECYYNSNLVVIYKVQG